MWNEVYMNEATVFIICLISLLLSISSLLVALRVAKNLRTAHQNIEVLHQALLDILHPQHQGMGPGQYVVAYIDEDGEYYSEEYETPANSFSKDDKVIDLFSRQALEWDAELKEWMPKIPEDLDEN